MTQSLGRGLAAAPGPLTGYVSTRGEPWAKLSGSGNSWPSLPSRYPTLSPPPTHTIISLQEQPALSPPLTLTGWASDTLPDKHTVSSEAGAGQGGAGQPHGGTKGAPRAPASWGSDLTTHSAAPVILLPPYLAIWTHFTDERLWPQRDSGPGP